MNRREGFFPLCVVQAKGNCHRKYDLVNGDSGEQCWTFFLNSGEIKN